MQLKVVNEAKIVFGIIAFIKDQGELGTLRGRAKTVAEKLGKALDDQRKLFGIMAVALVDLLGGLG